MKEDRPEGGLTCRGWCWCPCYQSAIGEATLIYIKLYLLITFSKLNSDTLCGNPHYEWLFVEGLRLFACWREGPACVAVACCLFVHMLFGWWFTLIFCDKHTLFVEIEVSVTKTWFFNALVVLYICYSDSLFHGWYFFLCLCMTSLFVTSDHGFFKFLSFFNI